MVFVFRISLGKLGKLRTFRHSLLAALHPSQHHTSTFRHWQHGRGILSCRKCGRGNSLMSLPLNKLETRSAYRSCRSVTKTVFPLLHFRAMAPALSLVCVTNLCGYGMPRQAQN